MKHWYARPVFFVKDAQDALAFFIEKLGFSPDWNHEVDGRTFVCQVRRDGFELILAQDADKAGRGRVFISLDDEQMRSLRADIEKRKIPIRETHWGMPVIEILDIDNNEIFISPPG
ncbi:MAG TPA: glyoxalase superfamily protein [Steroidobacteraceae bacterium]|jgi:catechol 2,3-dioxygenase-like lactoylglutathione lyase family enzyme|nr:glyoxalase superfamily protein [Steroidobacteraceae bacterium]